MQDIAIAVSETGNAQARTFDYRIIVAGEVVAERTLSPVQTSQVREMAMQYLSLLQGVSQGGKSYLSILGAGLFHLFLETGWQEFGSKVLQGGRLIINSSIPEVLQLPWEQLRLPGLENILGLCDDFSIIRQPNSSESLSSSSQKLAPGPLRVLFLAAQSLDYEREESEILLAAEGLDLTLEISEAGTWEELKGLAEAFRPHLVHLVGQGRMSGAQAQFSMPDAGGRPDLRSAEDLAGALKNSGARLIILGGRQNEPLFAQGLLCQSLLEHIPMALAWNDRTTSAISFYHSLAGGQPLDTALKTAVRETQKNIGEAGAITAFPVLYATSYQSHLFDPQKMARNPNAVCKEQSALPGMTEGYAECFVDRRRDLQQFIPALLDGTIHTLIITGPAGAGKSTLATHLARKLMPFGYSILPIYASPKNPISSARLLEAVLSQITAAISAEELKRLKDPNLSVKERLKNSMEVLSANRILMVWDDLDLDSETGKIRDPILKDFYLQSLQGMASSRVIIACQTLPAEASVLPIKARELRLAGLSETSFIKYQLRDEIVADRYRKGEVSYADLQELYSRESRNQVHLAQMRRALRTAFSPGDDALALLSTSLNPMSRQALSRNAVYNIAMSPAGLAAVAEVSIDTAIANVSLWQSLSLAYGVGKLWAVPSPDRATYLALLGAEEQRNAQKLAGDFLRDLGESGRSSELSLSRLDCLLEARGHYLAAADLENAIVVTTRISSYLEKRGYYSELIRLNQELLAPESNVEPVAWIARSYADQGDYEAAQEWYERAIEIEPVAYAYQGLGNANLFNGKHDLAKANLQKAVDIYVSQGDKAGELASLQGLASIDMDKDENELAYLKLQKIVEISDSLGDLRSHAAALQEMARLDTIRRDFEAARSRLLESLELIQKLGDKPREAVVIFNLASLSLEKGDFTIAGQEFQKALRLSLENGDRRGIATIRHSLGLIDSQSGDKEKARENFEEALKIFQELKDRQGEAGAFFQLGAIAVQQDRMPEGLRLMAMAAIILRSIKSDEVKNVEPLVERLASQLGFAEVQFMTMVQEVLQSYVKDMGWGLVEKASGR